MYDVVYLLIFLYFLELCCQQRQRAEGLETLIDEYGLIVNIDMTVATRPKQTSGRSIIDLTLTSSSLEYLPVWAIDPELANPSDHELITFDLENLENSIGTLGPSTEITEWSIKDVADGQKGGARQA